MTNDPTSEPRKTILVVDDEPAVTKLVVRILEENGFGARAVHDPRHALEKAVEIHPDLVLLDFDMPHILGPEVALLLKKNPATCTIPIIFLSGMTDADHYTIGNASGAVGYLNKPLDKTSLLAAVRTTIRG
jgi:DNA-binding response OmpR family regulator